MKQHSARLERSTVGWEPEHSSLAEGRLLWRSGSWPCSMHGRPPSFKSKSVL